MKAIARYAFDARAHDELSVRENEEIFIVNQDVADGWWLARNSRNEEGIVPVSYVELMSLPEPTMPPPPPPMAYQAAKTNHRLPSYESAENENSDDWDSDYDDIGGNEDPANKSSTKGAGGGGAGGPKILRHHPSSNDISSSQRQSSRSEDTRSMRLSAQVSDNAKFDTIRKGFKRSYVKSGAEEFLLGLESSVKVDASCVEAVVENGPNDQLRWQRAGEMFTAEISNYKKSTKLHGMKSYVSYSLIPSHTRIQVNRRFKQFDWLHRRLIDKFICICVPTLPEKQVAALTPRSPRQTQGRFEIDFIQERLRFLQIWLNRVVKHPILGNSKVIQHFLTCTDEKKWKQGKREAERDQLQGMKFFFAVQAPSRELVWDEEQDQAAKFEIFVVETERSTKMALDRVARFNSRQRGVISKEYLSLSEGFKSMADSLVREPWRGHESLSKALAHTGGVYNSIGEMFEKQPIEDGDKLVEQLTEQNRMVSCMPTLVSMYRGAATTALETRRAEKEDKLEAGVGNNIREKACYIVEAVKAENNWLRQERDEEIRQMMADYLRQQVKFYSEITDKLRETLTFYENHT